MNRTALGLAIGAGYFLGRTKKLKMALAVGSLVAGKKLNLSPKMLADVVSQQLKNNPQIKEIGDQLRGDLRGVGKAASGAMVERQMNSLADRLHGHTAKVREQLSGGLPTGSDEDQEDGGEDGHEDSAEEPAEDRDREDRDREDRHRESESRGPRPAKKAPAKKAAAKKTAAKKAAPAKKAAAKKTDAARRTVGKKTAAASRQRKGGDDR